jgi:formamidopyrimidine-DNA glycosylase
VPELPEVEAAARVLERAALGKRITELRLLHPALQRRAGDCAEQVRGRTIARVERRGKHQLVTLDDDSVLHVHFRMSGDWLVGRRDDAEPRHARAVLELEDGTRVSLVDPRALATVTLHRTGGQALPELGMEATDPALDAGALGRALGGRRAAVKTALLDQRVLAGLGNIYAAEALWHARIDPRSPAASLRPASLERLVAGIREALAVAADDPGRYSRGEATDRLHVYGREGEPCHRCGARIRRIVQGGRSTYFCPRCQRLSPSPRRARP